jgi:hypothetical protein
MGRRHHWLSQFYLRGFLSPDCAPNDDPYLWVFDRAEKTLKRRSPRNVAFQSGYFALEGDAGADMLTVEEETGRIESAAAHALRTYLGRPVGHRGQIPIEVGRFVARLAAGVPWMRRIASEQIGIKLTQNQGIDLVRVQSWYFEQHFARLSWTILATTPQSFFLTSDRPLIWYLPGGSHSASAAALKQPGVEVIFPLNRTNALLGTGEPADPRSEISPSDINLRLVCFSDQLVFSPNRETLERAVAGVASLPLGWRTE